MMAARTLYCLSGARSHDQPSPKTASDTAVPRVIRTCDQIASGMQRRPGGGAQRLAPGVRGNSQRRITQAQHAGERYRVVRRRLV